MGRDGQRLLFPVGIFFLNHSQALFACVYTYKTLNIGEPRIIGAVAVLGPRSFLTSASITKAKEGRLRATLSSPRPPERDDRDGTMDNPNPVLSLSPLTYSPCMCAGIHSAHFQSSTHFFITTPTTNAAGPCCAANKSAASNSATSNIMVNTIDWGHLGAGIWCRQTSDGCFVS